MTGKDMMMYIIQNDLYDKELFGESGFSPEIMGLISVEEAALKLHVGVETVKTLMVINDLPLIMMGKSAYVTKNSLNHTGNVFKLEEEGTDE